MGGNLKWRLFDILQTEFAYVRTLTLRGVFFTHQFSFLGLMRCLPRLKSLDIRTITVSMQPDPPGGLLKPESDRDILPHLRDLDVSRATPGDFLQGTFLVWLASKVRPAGCASLTFNTRTMFSVIDLLRVSGSTLRHLTIFSDSPNSE